MSSSTFSIPQRFPYHWLLFKWLDLMMQARDMGNYQAALLRAETIYSFLRPSMKREVSDPRALFMDAMSQHELPNGGGEVVDVFAVKSAERRLVASVADEVILRFSEEVMAAMDKAGMLDMFRTSVYETSEEA